VQQPRAAAAFIEVVLQQNAAVVIDQVANRRVQVLSCAIEQLRAVIRADLRHMFELLSYVIDASTFHLGVYENLNDAPQVGNLTVVEATCAERRQYGTRRQPLLVRRVFLRIDCRQFHCKALQAIPALHPDRVGSGGRWCQEQRQSNGQQEPFALAGRQIDIGLRRGSQARP